MGLGVPFPFPKPCGVSLSLGVYKRLAGARVRPPVPPSVHLEFPNCHPCGKGWRGGWGRAGRVPSRAASPPPPPRLPPVPGRASGFPVLLKPGCVLRETGVHPAGNRGASYRSVHPSFAGDISFSVAHGTRAVPTVGLVGAMQNGKPGRPWAEGGPRCGHGGGRDPVLAAGVSPRAAGLRHGPGRRCRHRRGQGEGTQHPSRVLPPPLCGLARRNVPLSL